eukprot:COSAG03_NODE_12402_length_549_cov_0.684444_2_plen_43_part_01
MLATKLITALSNARADIHSRSGAMTVAPRSCERPRPELATQGA